MRLKLILFFCVLSSALFCQEAIQIFSNNLNNYSKIQSGEPYRFHMFIIDSSTTFENVELLEDLEYLELDIRISEFPKVIDPKKLTKVHSISISGDKLKDLSALAAFTGVTELKLRCPQLESLDFLKNMSELRSATFNCPKLKTFPWLKKNKLESLHLTVNGQYEFKNLRSLTLLKELLLEKTGLAAVPDYLPAGLETFDISDDPDLNDIHNLALYKRLKKLTIENTGLKVISGDFSGLAPDEVTLIENKLLSDVNAIFSIKKINKTFHLSCLEELKSIDLSGKCFDYAELMINHCGKLSEIKGQSGCTQIHRLTLINNGFKRFPDLEHIADLERLDIYQNDLVDLGGLKNMKSLKMLGMYLPLQKIPESFFTNTAIEDLYISNTLLTDVSFVKRFPGLKRLTIAANEQLEKIPELEYLSQLEYLIVFGNYKLQIRDLRDGNNWRIFSNRSIK